MVGQAQAKTQTTVWNRNHHHSNYPPTLAVGPVTSTLVAKVLELSNEMECIDDDLAVIEFWTRHATFQQGFDSHVVLATNCLETFREPVMFHFSRYSSRGIWTWSNIHLILATLAWMETNPCRLQFLLFWQALTSWIIHSPWLDSLVSHTRLPYRWWRGLKLNYLMPSHEILGPKDEI